MKGRIIRYNTHEEDHTQEEYNFYIGRSRQGNPLANPFTFNGLKTNLAKMSFETRDEAVDAYAEYFKRMYGKDEDLTKAFDEIYEAYKCGNDIYLQCFCPNNVRCHGDVLINELQKKLVKEKMQELRQSRNTKNEEQKNDKT